MTVKHYWYVAQENELFADLDLSKSAQRRLVIARARLRGAKHDGRLNYDSYCFYKSITEFHYHLMVKLKSAMDPLKRILWENRLCDDSFRNNMNLARFIEGGKSWSLLISPYIRQSYWRTYDHMCECPSKHTSDTMELCPIAQKLDCVLAKNHFGDPIYLEDRIILGKPTTD